MVRAALFFSAIFVNLERNAESEDDGAIGEVIDRWRVGVSISETGRQIVGDREIHTQHPVDIVVDAKDACRIAKRPFIQSNIGVHSDRRVRNSGRSTGIDIDIV